MFTKEEMLHITKCSEEDLLWARRNKALRTSRRMGKMGGGRRDPLYPEHALSDLHHVSFLRKQKLRPREVRRLIFGEEGEVLFEEEIRNRLGRVLAVPIGNRASDPVARLSRLVDEAFPGRRVIQQAFRTGKTGARSFLILSRLVLGSQDEASQPLKVYDDLEGLETVVFPQEVAILLPIVREWLFPHLQVQKFVKRRKKHGRRVSLR